MLVVNVALNMVILAVLTCKKYKDDLVVLGFPANDFLWQEQLKIVKLKLSVPQNMV